MSARMTEQPRRTAPPPPRHNVPATLWRAERAMSPMRGFTPMEVRDGMGFTHGFLCCVGNVEAVEAKRKSDHAKVSTDRRWPMPIWC